MQRLSRAGARTRSGFTLVELLAVIAIGLIIVGALAVPAISAVRRNASITATRSVVLAVAAAAKAYGGNLFQVPDATSAYGVRSYPLWDCDGNGELDGEPDRGTPLGVALTDAGYHGFARTARPGLPPHHTDRSGRIVDAWKRPLRIAWAASAYGTDSFGVWSLGPNGRDDTAGATYDVTRGVLVSPAGQAIDDITSWTGR